MEIYGDNNKDSEGFDYDSDAHREALKSASPANGQFLRISLERLFNMPDEMFEETLEGLMIGRDCPCLKGEDCGSQAPEDFMRLRVAIESLRHSRRDFPDNEYGATLNAFVEDVVEMMNNDPELIMAVLVFAITRLNEYEGAYRYLQNGG